MQQGRDNPSVYQGVNKADGYAQDGTLLSPKQEGDPVSCYNMDEPLGCSGKQAHLKRTNVVGFH